MCQAGDGRLELYVATAHVRNNSHSDGLTNLAEAKEAQRLRSEVTLGGDPAAKREERKAIPTYGEFADQHLAHAKTYQRSYETTEMYVPRHIKPRWGKCLMSEIKKPDVAKWLADKAEEGLAPATVEKIRVIFGRAFELAIEWNVPGVTRNPTHGISRQD